jgi:hypothetical protein
MLLHFRCYLLKFYNKLENSKAFGIDKLFSIVCMGWFPFLTIQLVLLFWLRAPSFDSLIDAFKKHFRW